MNDEGHLDAGADRFGSEEEVEAIVRLVVLDAVDGWVEGGLQRAAS